MGAQLHIVPLYSFGVDELSQQRLSPALRNGSGAAGRLGRFFRLWLSNYIDAGSAKRRD